MITAGDGEPYSLRPLLLGFLCPVMLLVLGFSFFIFSPAIAQSPFSGFNPASLSHDTNSVFIEGRTLWANNAFPLTAIFLDKGWDGPFDPKDTNRLDIFWKVDSGVTYSGWRIAAFNRGELFAEANKDAVEILRKIQLRESLPVSGKFDIRLKARGFSASGIEISKGINLNRVAAGLTAGITVRYLKGEKIQEGRIAGNVIPTGSNTYDFDLFLDYLYDHNYLYKREDAIAGSGEGYGFDIGMRYVFNEDIQAEILFRDIAGRIFWKKVPYTKANATSDVSDFDKNGYQIFRPVIRGFEGYKDFRQDIPIKTDFVLSYRRGPFMVTPTINFIEDRPLFWIILDWQAAKNFYAKTSYNFNYKVFSLGFTYKTIAFSAYLNDIIPGDIKTVGLTASAQYRW
jgi:hypothetical protein